MYITTSLYCLLITNSLSRYNKLRIQRSNPCVSLVFLCIFVFGLAIVLTQYVKNQTDFNFDIKPNNSSHKRYTFRFPRLDINILSVLDMKCWSRCCQSKARPLFVLGVAVLCCMLVRWIVSSGCKYHMCRSRGWGFGGGPPPTPLENSNLSNSQRKLPKKVSPMENKIIIEKSKCLTVNIAYCLVTNITGSRKDACTY